jgi:anti-sigma factor RsiW
MSIRETCEAIEPLLAPYGEPESAGELPAADRDRVSAHLAVCEPCRRQAGACRAAHEALRARAADLITPAPPLLAARCRAAAARASAPRRAARWVGWSAAAATAAAILFVFILPAQAVATQLAVDHMKCSKFAAASAMTGTPADLERAWFVKRRQQISIPDGFAPDGLRLIGLRRCISTEGNMAHVMYERSGAPVSLFIYRAGGAAHPAGQVEAIGHKAILWSEGSNTYALVGRGQDLTATAALMQRLMKTR